MGHVTAAAAALAATIAAATAAGPALAAPGMPGGPGDLMGGFHGAIDVVAIDTDGNGALSRAELQARAVERLARADANGDGSLDRVELIALMPAPPGALLDVFAEDPAERMADRLIALMGGTEAGRIDIAALADRRVNALFAIVDTDRDASLSADEIAVFSERADRHGPGKPPHGAHGQRGARGADGPGRAGPQAGPDGDGPRFGPRE